MCNKAKVNYYSRHIRTHSGVKKERSANPFHPNEQRQSPNVGAHETVQSTARRERIELLRQLRVNTSASCTSQGQNTAPISPDFISFLDHLATQTESNEALSPSIAFSSGPADLLAGFGDRVTFQEQGKYHFGEVSNITIDGNYTVFAKDGKYYEVKSNQVHPAVTRESLGLSDTVAYLEKINPFDSSDLNRPSQLRVGKVEHVYKNGQIEVSGNSNDVNQLTVNTVGREVPLTSYSLTPRMIHRTSQGSFRVVLPHRAYSNQIIEVRMASLDRGSIRGDVLGVAELVPEVSLKTFALTPVVAFSQGVGGFSTGNPIHAYQNGIVEMQSHVTGTKWLAGRDHLFTQIPLSTASMTKSGVIEVQLGVSKIPVLVDVEKAFSNGMVRLGTNSSGLEWVKAADVLRQVEIEPSKKNLKVHFNHTGYPGTSVEGTLLRKFHLGFYEIQYFDYHSRSRKSKIVKENSFRVPSTPKPVVIPPVTNQIIDLPSANLNLGEAQTEETKQQFQSLWKIGNAVNGSPRFANAQAKSNTQSQIDSFVLRLMDLLPFNPGEKENLLNNFEQNRTKIWRKLKLTTHPDKNTNPVCAKLAEEIFKSLYLTLEYFKDPKNLTSSR